MMNIDGDESCCRYGERQISAADFSIHMAAVKVSNSTAE